MVFDLSEPLVFKFFGGCNHGGSQGRRAHTLHLRMKLLFYLFWNNIFPHSLYQDKDRKSQNTISVTEEEDRGYLPATEHSHYSPGEALHHVRGPGPILMDAACLISVLILPENPSPKVAAVPSGLQGALNQPFYAKD